MPVTLKTIAEEAGVSLPVVSAVLNKKSKNSRVGDGTRKRIEEIADKLNYLPNSTAQALRNKETKTVHVVIPSFRFFEVEHYTSMVTSMQEQLQENGYDLQVMSLASAFRNMKLIRHIDTDGVILFYWGMKHDLVDELRKLDVSVLVLNGRYEGGKASNLYIDQQGAMYDLASAVIRAGHRKIVYIDSYPGDITHQEMAKGVLRAAADTDGVKLERMELQPDRSLPEEADKGVDLGRRGLDKALEAEERPTAVMFNDDLLAMAAVQRAGELGLRVPEDISITGGGDTRLAKVCTPQLATTQNKYRHAGTEAGKMILEEIKDNRKAVRQVSIPSGAVIRASLGTI